MTKIGPFFVNGNEIISHRIQYVNGRNTNNLIDNDYNHYELFDKYANKFDTDEYIHVPRGRVLYDIDNQVSIIYIDSCLINNDEIIQKIISHFEVNKFTIESDTHYQCIKCVKIDLFE